MISSHDEIYAAHDRAVEELITQPYVWGVGILHDHPHHALNVYTTDVGKVEESFAGFPVERLEISPFDIGPEPFPQEELEQHVRPALGGVSIGPAHRSLGGTLGSAVFTDTEMKMFLSNWHVLALSNEAEIGSAILQPAIIDGGSYPDDLFGTLEAYQPLMKPSEGYNKVDAALGAPISPDDLSTEIWGVGKVAGHSEPQVGQTVVLASRGGLTEGTVVDTDGVFKVKGYPWGWSLFEDQIVVSPAIEPHGASGGLVVDPKTMSAVGLAFAGNNSFSMANKASNVSKALGIHWGSFY